MRLDVFETIFNKPRGDEPVLLGTPWLRDGGKAYTSGTLQGLRYWIYSAVGQSLFADFKPEFGFQVPHIRLDWLLSITIAHGFRQKLGIHIEDDAFEGTSLGGVTSIIWSLLRLAKPDGQSTSSSGRSAHIYEANRKVSNKSKRSESKAREEGGGNDDEARREGKRPRLLDDPEQAVSKAHLACPFFKRRPRRYANQPSCRGHSWPTVHRLKEYVASSTAIVSCISNL